VLSVIASYIVYNLLGGLILNWCLVTVLVLAFKNN